MNQKPEERLPRYKRYHINTQPSPDLIRRPSRFTVKVGKKGLAVHLLKSLIRNRFDLKVVTSRPCIYGVFSGPIGGFSPRPQLCVGCLRCTTEFPEFVQILPNPERNAQGDGFFTPQQHETILYEAETGRIPVRGAGYRGRFGGRGWDGIWTDMSEIVRPTRDGIHGREYISTRVDIGSKPAFLHFDESGLPSEEGFHFFSIQVPFFFDLSNVGTLPENMIRGVSQAVADLGTLLVIPLETAVNLEIQGNWIVPLIKKENISHLKEMRRDARLVQVSRLEPAQIDEVRRHFPSSILCLRSSFPNSAEFEQVMSEGINVYHFAPDPAHAGQEVHQEFESIRAIHRSFVERRQRDEVTLIGGSSIAAAEHIPKAVIAGLDAVAVDTALLAAMQGRSPDGEPGSATNSWTFPPNPPPEWVSQRVLNLSAAWRDQLLEVLGAMGLREVRRLRGEIGRVMFQKDLEKEAFAGIEGYHG